MASLSRTQLERFCFFNPAAERLMRAGLGTIAPLDSYEQHQTYLSDTLTAYPTNEHPLVRAMRGESLTARKSFCANPIRPMGFG